MSCEGCGVNLQTEHPSDLGFIPSSSYDQGDRICRRCYRIHHYGEIQPILQNEESYISVLHSVTKQKSLLVVVVDLFFLEESFPPRLVELLRDRPFLFVGNKVDLFPRSVKHEGIIKYLRATLVERGLMPLQIVLCSAKGEIQKVIEAVDSYRQGMDVTFFGASNAGKSTLINQLVKRENKVATLTTSAYPGTTLEHVRIPLRDGSFLIDTPGHILNDRMDSRLTPHELQQIVPKKTLKPRSYQLNEGQTVFLGGLSRLDYIQGENQPFIFYVSNQLYLHRTKQKNAEAFFKEHHGKMLTPYMASSFWEKHCFHFSGNRKEDLVISGLGWISCGREKGNVVVFLPKGIKVKRRKAFI